MSISEQQICAIIIEADTVVESRGTRHNYNICVVATR